MNEVEWCEGTSWTYRAYVFGHAHAQMWIFARKKTTTKKQSYFLFQKFNLTNIVRVRVSRKIELTSSDVLNIPKNSCLINMTYQESSVEFNQRHIE